MLIHSCRYPCGKGSCHSLASAPGLMSGTRKQQLRLVSSTALQLAPVRRAEAPGEAGDLQSFICPINIFIALALGEEQGH